MGAHVGVQQQLAILAELRITARTLVVLPFEIPDAPAFRAAVVRHDLNVSVHDVSLRGRIARSLVGFPTVRGGKTGVQQREAVLLLWVEDLHEAGQADGIPATQPATDGSQ